MSIKKSGHMEDTHVMSWIKIQKIRNQKKYREKPWTQENWNPLWLYYFLPHPYIVQPYIQMIAMQLKFPLNFKSMSSTLSNSKQRLRSRPHLSTTNGVQIYHKKCILWISKHHNTNEKANKIPSTVNEDDEEGCLHNRDCIAEEFLEKRNPFIGSSSSI